ncbi:hypothetical protein T492DRAFT_25602 [Pavlovales sp. CCMP2436]|nr:hypothetical protein T492DRAFT_25602 [Pavlovales sp. CCMP2436]
MQSAAKGLVGWLSGAVGGKGAPAPPAPKQSGPASLAELFRPAPWAPPARSSGSGAGGSSESGARESLFAGASPELAAPEAPVAGSRKQRALAGEAASARSGMQESVEALQQRGAKLNSLGERVERLNAESEDFFNAARKLREANERKAGGLFGFF